MMNIHYGSQEEMIEIVKGLVIAGLTFSVVTELDTIELTGGY
jgi:hypothetical protein